MELISLSSLIEASQGESEFLQQKLSSFQCSKNGDVELFLHTKAIEMDGRSIRTTLVIDEKSSEIVGYFTIGIKPFKFGTVSGSLKQKLSGNKNAELFNTILIAQLGRSDAYKSLVSGTQILDFALKRCNEINTLAALRVVSVEYEDNPKLNHFYENNGFKFIQINDNGLKLSYVRL
ncbi:GNAT family N-acetyltransferase [Bacillus tuaregi]|uniref:GNAT family N-acetyltransferase n=1 Tax=Bacillus tuaregi TaxID=1816695 RepID=UPI0008F84D60|nr:GNAT family N-acetyltransferase [Bacillus tuaregi]